MSQWLSKIPKLKGYKQDCGKTGKGENYTGNKGLASYLLMYYQLMQLIFWASIYLHIRNPEHLLQIFLIQTHKNSLLETEVILSRYLISATLKYFPFWNRGFLNALREGNGSNINLVWSQTIKRVRSGTAVGMLEQNNYSRKKVEENDPLWPS